MMVLARLMRDGDASASLTYLTYETRDKFLAFRRGPDPLRLRRARRSLATVTAVQSLRIPHSLPLRPRWAAFARVALALGAVLLTAACTETPSYFPPCVDTAPCPDAGDDATDAASDALAATDALGPADAAAEAH
jgi:hypothetical protein